MAFAETFVAGKDYEVINDAFKPVSGNQVAVMEFFSFGCPWCYRVEPSLTNWVKKQEGRIALTRIPVVFKKDWGYYAKAYYAAELLGLSDKLNPLLFKAIQTDKLPLNSDQAMIDFFVAQGVDKETAESAFTHSTTIDMKVSEGSAIMAKYHVNAVPAFVINKQYKTDLQMAQGEDRLFKIMDFLIAKSQKKD
jgi:thiol:disulfide interchange protein DsbA